VVYLPLGLLEWHGPHLPLGVDAFNAEAVAQRAAEISGGLVMPTVYCGTERERYPEMLDWIGLPPEDYVVGMDFPTNSLPSGYSPEEIFALVVREQIRIAVTLGFKVMALVTGHAATNQIEVLERLAAEVNAGSAIKVLVELPFVHDEDGVLAVGHASRIETAVMLALNPDTVALDTLPSADQSLRNADYAIVDYETFMGHPMEDRTVRPADDPRQASADAGTKMMDRAAHRIAENVSTLLSSPRN
jgi:creatinine amidohydrolase